MIDALQQSHAKLSKQVRTLEQERQHHLTIIERLKEYAPQHVLRVLEAEQKIISQLSTDSAISMSGGDTLPSVRRGVAPVPDHTTMVSATQATCRPNHKPIAQVHVASLWFGVG